MIKSSTAFSGNVEEKEKVSPAFGIDLGTTNSAISVVGNSDVPHTIKLIGGKMTMPSCVLWDSNAPEGKQFIVGDEALEQRYKPNAVYSVKRKMGSGEMVKFIHGKKSITKTPAEVSALILKALVEKASVQYKNIKDVVITVPAEFDTKQIEDTRLAGELAGLNVLNIMREPTAASIVYKLDKKPGNVLVYDLGGGTFDVSLVEVNTASTGGSDLLDALGIEDDESTSKDTITVKATRGDTKLGGDDLDVLMYRVLEKGLRLQGVDPTKVPKEVKEKTLLRLQKSKSNVDYLAMDYPFKYTQADGTQVDTVTRFTMRDYKRCTYRIFQRTKVYIDDLLNSQNINIDAIVLVGGSTKNKFLKEFLAKEYPNVHLYDYLNPDESVADGAAVNAKRLKFGSDDLEIFDVTSNRIGVEADGRIITMIEKNQTVPCTQSKSFATSVDNQQKVSINIYEGSGIYKEDCNYLGTVVLDDIPKGKANSVAIYVSLTVDDNGLLTCTGRADTKAPKKLELVNILGRKVEKETKSSNVMFERWYAFANKLEDDAVREELLELIDNARVNPDGAREVIEYMRKLG